MQIVTTYFFLIISPSKPLSAGTCIGVGISGLILGGGIGPFTRSAGLTADNVLSATVGLTAGTTTFCL